MKELKLDEVDAMGRMIDATVFRMSQLKSADHAKLRIAKN
jgi:hypothetical protein